ncbi:chromosome-associated kinesin KIF4-like [Atheta coriaria]|uniref:chromosome-associated kinesin KIF4-like n=1 Tax=Dalotia coriaria TaxID=877792 RepID=UPI0031F3BFA7
MADNSCVQVALRIRPLVESEIKRGCKSALEVFQDQKQVQISDKAFTYNYVFGSEATQEEFYKQSVEKLVPNLFKGYNVTILAYGQTGSGKTHTMGTAYNGTGEMGIIPRAVHDIFTFINDNFSYDFNVTVSFMELYQEVLYDLLSSKPREQCVMEIREDVNKNIYIPGLTELQTKSAQEVLDCLAQGSKGRATSSTNMNSQSSRSHAIFTINISMTTKGSNECKTAKFHLVDLAGSERPKKTGASGQTFKEGVNINKGLFVLGNVISALGDEKGAPAYVNFRESNLTRLLKDSLGGNSITIMVVCVSPADYNAEETLSTLRYADRARRIKNKPVVNEDPKAAEISKMQKLIQQLKLQISAQGGPSMTNEDLTKLQTEICSLKNKLQQTVSHNVVLNQRVILMQAANEGMAEKFATLQGEYSTTMQNFNMSMEQNDMDAMKKQMAQLKTIENHFCDIDNESKRSEAEIKNFDCTFVKDTDTVNYISEEEIDKQQESHMSKQIAFNAQIQNMNIVLAQKQDLAKQLASNALYMVDLEEMNDNQNKIAELEKEKIELIQQLKQAQTQGASGKIAEQRRKRVQELEAQLHELNRKVNEQARLIKLKEKDDLKIKKLNSEINSMKTEKVKLVKNMREESERFRKWKLDRERELSKLQNQDRKRLNQMENMKMKHTLQEKVWKRKLEEAASSAKRLKDALALRRNVQDSKLKGKEERLKPWVQQELTIHANTVVVQNTINTLVDDRSALQEQLDKLKENETENESEIQRLEEQVDMRSAQLQDLNQKLIESKDFERTRTGFDNVQTMADAKYVYQVMFDLTADIKKAEIEKEHKLDEAHIEMEEMKRKIMELETKNAGLDQKHAVALSEAEKEYEEKTLLLLKQLRGVQMQGIDEQTQHRIQAQEEMIVKLELVVESLQTDKDALLQALEEQTIAMASRDVPVAVTPPMKKKRSASIQDKVDNVKFLMPSAFDESFNMSIEDDTSNDPDWRRTPLGKQVRALRDSSIRVPLKRNHSGGCGCRRNCQRNCPCKKGNNSCSSHCNCVAETCANRVEKIQNVPSTKINFE